MKDNILDLGYAKIKLPKVEEQEEKKLIIITHCPFCDKKIRSSTHSQADWNFKLHLQQKHKDNEEAKILLKQLEEQNKEKWKKQKKS